MPGRGRLCHALRGRPRAVGGQRRRIRALAPPGPSLHAPVPSFPAVGAPRGGPAAPALRGERAPPPRAQVGILLPATQEAWRMGPAGAPHPAAFFRRDHRRRRDAARARAAPGRGPFRLHPGRRVPRREPGHGRRSPRERLRGRDPARPVLLRLAPCPQWRSRDGPGARPPPARLDRPRAVRRDPLELGGVRLAPEALRPPPRRRSGVRRPGRRMVGQGPRHLRMAGRDRVPQAGRAGPARRRHLPRGLPPLPWPRDHGPAARDPEGDPGRRAPGMRRGDDVLRERRGVFAHPARHVRVASRPEGGASPLDRGHGRRHRKPGLPAPDSRWRRANCGDGRASCTRWSSWRRPTGRRRRAARLRRNRRAPYTLFGQAMRSCTQEISYCECHRFA